MAKRKKTIVAGDLIKTVIYTAPEPRDGPGYGRPSPA